MCSLSPDHRAGLGKSDSGRGDGDGDFVDVRQATEDGGACDRSSRIAEMHREDLSCDPLRRPEEARDLMEKHLRMAQAAQGVDGPRTGKRQRPCRKARRPDEVRGVLTGTFALIAGWA